MSPEIEEILLPRSFRSRMADALKTPRVYKWFIIIIIIIIIIIVVVVIAIIEFLERHVIVTSEACLTVNL